MTEDSSRLYCAVCGGSGILAPGRICPACEGEGRVRPMLISVPLITPSEAWPGDTRWWSRLAVLSADRRRGRVLVRGVCETGVEMSASVRSDALAKAPRIVLVETRGGR